MRIVRGFSALALAVAMAGSGVVVAACGGEGAKASNVTPGDMPEGETWSGVYYHPVYGYLHMVEQDTNVVGRWKRTDQSAWGEMSGTKQGNVVHFTWKEHKYGMVGPSASSHGKGYFVFKLNSNKTGELDGQFGLDNDETGSEWHLVKQQRMQPDLNSITADAPAGQPGTGALE